jgi:hypothetical protein
LDLPKTNTTQITKGSGRQRDHDGDRRSHSQPIRVLFEEEDSSSDESQEGVGGDDDITEYSRVRLLARELAKWNSVYCDSRTQISSDGLELRYNSRLGIKVALATKPFRHRMQRGRLSDNDEFSYFEFQILDITNPT